MSKTEELARLIEQLYATDCVLTAMQKKPHIYAGVSLHTNEAHTLKMIAQSEGISQIELSDQMLRTKGATSLMVDKLVEKGLVRRERVDGDQRRYLLTLTEAGLAVHAAHLARDEYHTEKAGRELSLTEEDLTAANRVLEQINTFYSKNYLDHGRAVTPEV